MELFIAAIYIFLIILTVVVRRALKLRSYQATRSPNARSTLRMQSEFNRHS